MKKLVCLILLVLLLIGLVGCSDGVSQEEYDAVVAESDALREQVETMTKQKGNQPAEQEVEYQEEEPVYKEQYPSGQYKVGADIPAGEYVVLADGDSGYFSVSSDANKEEIIFNGNFDYNTIIMILDGEFLELSRSTAVPVDAFYDVNTVDLSKDGIMLSVGKDIEAGEYKLICKEGESGYYCIYNSSRQDEIITNSIFENSAYVSVSDGQYLDLSRCYISE